MDRNSNQEDKRHHTRQQPPADHIQQERRSAEEAHEQAEHDMENDVELSAHSPNDDLDEGETARLGEDISKFI